MSNPWETISLNDYENHMKLKTVQQLQAMNVIMRDQFYRYPISSVMILGIAGGNGLNHIDIDRIKMVYGVDVNRAYLEACAKRYPQLENIFVPIPCDLQEDNIKLPSADMVIANLLVEYIGYSNFQKVVKQVRPQFASCVIQVNADSSFVSFSPYLPVFDCLQEIHKEIDEYGIIQAMREIEYNLIYREDTALPNQKSLLRLDFTE